MMEEKTGKTGEPVETRLKPDKRLELDRFSLEAILDTVPSAIVLVDADDGRFSYMNRRALELYGCSYIGSDLDSHVGRVLALRPDGTPHPLAEMPISKSLKFGVSVRNVEMTIEHADGTRLPVLVSSAPLFDKKGRVIAASAMFEEFTERKRAEEALRESEARQVFLLALSDGLRLLSDPFDIQAEACRLLGEFFGADRACYADIREDEGVAIVRPDYFRDGLTTLVGRYALADFAELTTALRNGNPFSVSDVGN